MPKAPIDRGHPDLVLEISAEIRRSGPMTFARFMELALYHPQYGYYMTEAADPAPHESTPDRAYRTRIGWSGDYYTSSDVHPFLGQALARQARQLDGLLGRPTPFTVVEMGPGKGLLARDFLAALQAEGSGCFDRLRYVLIERSPVMRTLQQEALRQWTTDTGRVTWLDRLEDLTEESVVGLLYSNELVDAFPVHRITIQKGEAQELYVDEEGGRFVERAGALSTPELARYLEALARLDIHLQEGATAEINLPALAWMRQVAQALGRGLVLTIDYGHTAQDLHSPVRNKGTLLCYYHQMASETPYLRIGRQDMTAHVDFTMLAATGESAGLQVTGFSNQMSFLIGLGAEQALEAMEPGSAEFQGLVHLLRPDGMGRTFKVLIQQKAMDTPALEGLRYKPFFGFILPSAALSANRDS